MLNLDLLKDALPIQLALGVKWDMENDKFIFDGVLKDKPTTRRRILFPLVSSVYDPLGFLAPVLLPTKRLLQNLCREKVDGMIQLVKAREKDGKIGRKNCPVWPELQ